MKVSSILVLFIVLFLWFDRIHGQVDFNATVASGYDHTCSPKRMEDLWDLGSEIIMDNWGMVLLHRNQSVKIIDNNVTAVAGGQYHSLFVKSDGSLWAMGSKQFTDNWGMVLLRVTELHRCRS